MADLNKIMEKIGKHPDNRLYMGASQSEIEELEKALGHPLPPCFHRFLQISDGAMLYLYEEILGTRDNTQSDRLGILSARDFYRKNFSLPEHLIPFHLGTEIHCFDTEQQLPNGEYLIVRLTREGQYLGNDVNRSFCDWLENQMVVPNETT